VYSIHISRYLIVTCYLVCVSVTSSSSDLSSLTTATQSLNSSVDVSATAFIAQARHRGDGQDIDNTTSSSDTQYVLV